MNCFPHAYRKMYRGVVTSRVKANTKGVGTMADDATANLAFSPPSLYQRRDAPKTGPAALGLGDFGSGEEEGAQPARGGPKETQPRGNDSPSVLTYGTISHPVSETVGRLPAPDNVAPFINQTWPLPQTRFRHRMSLLPSPL